MKQWKWGDRYSSVARPPLKETREIDMSSLTVMAVYFSLPHLILNRLTCHFNTKSQPSQTRMRASPTPVEFYVWTSPVLCVCALSLSLLQKGELSEELISVEAGSADGAPLNRLRGERSWPALTDGVGSGVVTVGDCLTATAKRSLRAGETMTDSSGARPEALRFGAMEQGYAPLLFWGHRSVRPQEKSNKKRILSAAADTSIRRPDLIKVSSFNVTSA